jgi:hypothetical protein
MLKRVLQGVCLMIAGPVVGFWVVASTLMRGGDVGASSIVAILFATWLIFCLPIIGLKLMFWAGKVASKRWIEREVDDYRGRRRVESW